MPPPRYIPQRSRSSQSSVPVATVATSAKGNVRSAVTTASATPFSSSLGPRGKRKRGESIIGKYHSNLFETGRPGVQ